MTEQVVVNETGWPDSIEIGSPSKGGILKAYFNAGRPEETKERIANAHVALEQARKLMGGEVK